MGERDLPPNQAPAAVERIFEAYRSAAGPVLGRPLGTVGNALARAAAQSKPRTRGAPDVDGSVARTG